jgi:hypothetical protein
MRSVTSGDRSPTNSEWSAGAGARRRGAAVSAPPGHASWRACGRAGPGRGAWQAGAGPGGAGRGGGSAGPVRHGPTSEPSRTCGASHAGRARPAPAAPAGAPSGCAARHGHACGPRSPSDVPDGRSMLAAAVAAVPDRPFRPSRGPASSSFVFWGKAGAGGAGCVDVARLEPRTRCPGCWSMRCDGMEGRALLRGAAGVRVPRALCRAGAGCLVGGRRRRVVTDYKFGRPAGLGGRPGPVGSCGRVRVARAPSSGCKGLG